MSEEIMVAIDPSINDVGVVYLNNANAEFISSKHIKSDKSCSNAVAKVASVIHQLNRYLDKAPHSIVEIVIEHTRFFARSKMTSHASAQKLNLAKGAIFGSCLQRGTPKVELVWIPGFSKENANLLARSYQLPKMTQHERDAFWLGNSWSKANITLKKMWAESPDL